MLEQQPRVIKPNWNRVLRTLWGVAKTLGASSGKTLPNLLGEWPCGGCWTGCATTLHVFPHSKLSWQTFIHCQWATLSLPNSSEWNLSFSDSSSFLLPIYVKTLGSCGIWFFPSSLVLVTMETANGRKIENCFPQTQYEVISNVMFKLCTEYLGSWRMEI